MSEFFSNLKIISKIASVVFSKKYLFGPELFEFEKQFRNYLNVPFALGVKSGTDALVYALKALDIGPGDEVITTALTFASTAAAISWIGAKPVFVDIEETTFNIDPKKIEEKISERAKAIIIVHLHGHPAVVEDLVAIARKHNLWIIEDCAQALGATYNKQNVGTFGDIGCFSFAPWDYGSSKPLSAMGDGGAIVTWNKSIFNKINLLRQYGGYYREIGSKHVIVGGASRLDNIQAVVLNVKLDSLNKNLFIKRKFADTYNEILKGIPDIILPVVKPNFSHSFYHYVIRIKKRDALRSYLLENNIRTRINYENPVPFLKAFDFLNYKKGEYPVAEEIADEILTLPTSTSLSINYITRVANSVKEFFEVN